MNLNWKIVIVIFFSVMIQAQEYIGIIKPIYDIELSALVEGKVEKLFVKEGDRVKKGDKLLKIDDTLQKLEMDRREIIWKDRSQVIFAQKNEKILKSLLSSTRKLYNKTKAVSRDNLRALEMKYYTSQGDVQARIENEKKEKIEYDIAKNVLSQYITLSPIDGIVTKIIRHESEWTKRGEVLFRMVNTDLCFLEINVDERCSKSLKSGDAIEFKIEIEDKIIVVKAEVAFISPVADNSSGLVRLKIEFDNRSSKITPGISASINLE